MQGDVDNGTLPWHELAIMPNLPQIPPNLQKPPASRLIEVVAFQAVQLLDVTGPLQVFATTNDTFANTGAAQPYTLRIVARQTPSVTASAGVVLATGDLSPLDTPLDTLLVAGGQGVKVAADDTGLVSWVRARAETARRTASVCTGAFLLAAAGVLDGRRATTHWSFCDELAQCFPAVHVESDPIFVRDGAVWTSAGVTAGIDLALALVEEDLGREVALAVARYLVMFLKRPGGQSQFSTALSLQAAEKRFSRLHAWVNANLSRDLSLPILAAQAGMSEP